MKRSTAVRHLVEMTDDCAALVQRLGVVDSPVRVVSLWAYGDVLDRTAIWDDAARAAHAAVVVSQPEDEAPWLAPGAALAWVRGMVRWDKRPVVTVWRSSDAPVWNHAVVRPLLLWDAEAGVHRDALDALAGGGDLDALREPAPADAELRERLEREVAASLRAVRRCAAAYESRRWARANHLALADDLHAATAGYLDVLDALPEGS